MDKGTTIMGIVIVLICALPIILSTVNNSKRKKRILQGLYDFAAINNCKISKYAMINNLTIGIDEPSLMIFFIKKTNENDILQQINLSEIQKCKVINSARSVKSKDNSLNVIEKIELAFAFKDKNKKEILLEFYNHINDGSTFTGDVNLVEQWCEIINNKISTISKQI